MRRWIAIGAAITISLSGVTGAYANQTESKSSDQVSIEETQENKENKIDVIFVNHRLFVDTDDIMSLMEYEKAFANEYHKDGVIVSFSGNNSSVTINGMERVMPGEVQFHGGKILISTAGVESAFGKIMNTPNMKLEFNFIEKMAEVRAPYAWTENRGIAHALGGINGMSNTNTFEAMQGSYKNGFRLFEVDILPTSDGKLAVTHNYYEFLSERYGRPIPAEKTNEIPTKAEFMSHRVRGMYEPMEFEKLISIMSANKDIYIITDTKVTDPIQAKSQFDEIVRVVKEVDPSVLDRIIPQIYNESMYDTVMSSHPFKSMIYTLYSTSTTNSRALEFATSKGIKVVTIPPERITKEYMDSFNAYGVKVYTHTINNAEEAQRLLDMGVYGFYTDFLSPSQIENLR